MIEILPIEGIPDVSKGDNLGKLIVSRFQASGNVIRKGDIVVVAQKVVSKVEGRTVSLSKVKPSKFASEIAKLSDKDPRQVEVILRESPPRQIVLPNALGAEKLHHKLSCNRPQKIQPSQPRSHPPPERKS